MAKKITLPKSLGYPYTKVWVNNTVYELRTGEEIEVADEVAAVVENYIASEKKPEDHPKGYVGGYVPTPTHFEEEKRESIEGLEFVIPSSGAKGAGLKLELGQSWRVFSKSSRTGKWSEDYNLVFPVEQAADGTLYVGSLPNTNYPFYIAENERWMHSNWVSQVGVTDIKLVGVSGSRTIVNLKRLDAKYLPFFDFDVTMSSAGQYALTNLAQVMEAYDNNMTVKIVYSTTVSGKTASLVVTLPCIRDCMVIKNLSGLISANQYDSLSQDFNLNMSLNADDYAVGKVNPTSVHLYTPATYTLVKCYACPF